MLYPKIDAAVSSHTNHLLKAPFNIHSSSLLLSVPVDPENFDIAKIPSLSDIVLGKADLSHFIKDFREFITKLEDSRKRAKGPVSNGKRNIEGLEGPAALEKEMRKVKI